jgi:hypothetical protein
MQMVNVGVGNKRKVTVARPRGIQDYTGAVIMDCNARFASRNPANHPELTDLQSC